MKIKIIEPVEGELTAGGFTNRIQIAEGQTKESLLEYGFTNYNKPFLYMCKGLLSDITFNFSISIETLKISDIDIIDENGLQPYDYQRMIMEGSNNKIAAKVYELVNKTLAKLQEDGIITGFEEGMYI